jgi:Family of unknown function (DUF5397)
MVQNGFEESQTGYALTSGVTFIGEVRHFGPFGPAYEVVDVKPSGELVIHVFDNGEQLSYSVAEFLADPIAETIP